MGCSSGGKPNGEEKKTPTQVASDAKSALKTVVTAHVSGMLVVSGSSTGTSLDLHFRNGIGAYGTVSTQGKTIDVVRVGNDVYVRGDVDLFGPAAAKLIGNRYVKLSTTSGTGKALGDLTSLSSFADDMLTPDGKLQAGVARAKIAGRKALVVTNADTGSPSKLYVANTGSPVPLQVTGSGSSSGTMRFTQYGADVTVKVPANAVVLPSTS